jgi:hypothetical protein
MQRFRGITPEPENLLIKLEDKMLLEGKNAIVTGGSQGIGTAASL